MLTKLAVRWLTYKLRKDKELWYVYQSNIAMVIFDRVERYYPYLRLDKDYSPTLHEFCNMCANDFLTLWTKK